MIPQEKIEPMFTEKAVVVAKNMLDKLQNNSKYKPMRPFYIAGEIVMWDKMKDLACEFLEQVTSDGWVQDVQANNWKNVLDIKIPALVRMSTQQLFDKFLAERSEK